MRQSLNRAILLVLIATLATARAAEPIAAFSKGARILFQGNSITDGNRGRNVDPNHIVGHGYVFIIVANFGGHFPKHELVFMNRGVSGNNVTNLAARWPKDTLDLKPDVLSILIGINDATRVPMEQYEAVYDKLLADTLPALPNVRCILCEPFTLPIGKRKENWEAWNADVKERQTVVARFTAKYLAPLVRFQKASNEACQRAPAEHWIWDGVHPTYAGHQIMADEWVRTVNSATQAQSGRHDVHGRQLKFFLRLLLVPIKRFSSSCVRPFGRTWPRRLHAGHWRFNRAMTRLASAGSPFGRGLNRPSRSPLRPAAHRPACAP